MSHSGRVEARGQLAGVCPPQPPLEFQEIQFMFRSIVASTFIYHTILPAPYLAFSGAIGSFSIVARVLHSDRQGMNVLTLPCFAL